MVFLLGNKSTPMNGGIYTRAPLIQLINWILHANVAISTRTLFLLMIEMRTFHPNMGVVLHFLPFSSLFSSSAFHIDSSMLTH